MSFFLQRRAGAVHRLHQAARVLMLGLIFVFQFGPTYLMMANPLGEEVAAGQASFDRAGSTLTITTSDRVIINWQDFSIQSGELTKFVQPSVSSAALNRVMSGNPSQIFGTLQSNGQIYLINPNGILVGGGAVINTGGFIASTLDLNNSEFMSGGNMNFVGGSTASIENQGKIDAIGGDIILIAHEVNNSGEINAPNGVVGMAAGHDILLTQAGAEKVFVRPTLGAGTTSSHGILNSGVLAAARVELKAHGNLYALAINNGGIIRADGATIGENGRVMLTANGGHVRNTGMIAANGASGGTVSIKSGEAEIHGVVEARGTSGSGGAVTITGDRVGVSGATIDASGKTGGGSVKIGGDVHGANPDIANATMTTIAADATIKADATDTGDGGEVVVWADGKTDFEGVILARGGASGGNGGFAEVSGRELLNFKGRVDLRAASGTTGMLLLDPKNIAITAAGTDSVAGNDEFTDNPGGWSLISGADLSTAIDSASVTLQANTDIFINDDVTGTTVGNGLTLQAGRSISIEQNTTISLNGGDFSATINDDAAQVANRDAGLAAFSLENNAQILTGGGGVTISHGNLDGTGEGEVRLGLGTANDGVATISSGAGNINITGTGGSTGNGSGISMGNASVVQATSGSIAFSGTGDGTSPGINVTTGSNVIGGPSTSGNITLAAETTTGSDSISLANLSIQSSGELFLNPLVTATGIGVGGGSGDFNLSDAELDLIQTGFSKITIGLANGTGTMNVGAYTFDDSVKLQSAASAGDGAISLTGALATSGAGDTIELYGGKAVTISGGSVTTNNGDITIQGNVNGTYAAWTMGVDLNTGSSVSSGNGDILVVGNGGDGVGDWKIGIRAQSSSFQSTGGDITLQGSGGSIDSFNPGILVEWGGGAVTTATGNILLVGNGGGVASNNWGISIADGGAVSATGSGTVTLTGTGGGGTEINYGVKITGSGVVSVDSGNLQITGTVNAPTTQYNHGVDIDSGGQVLSDNGGTITIDGVGGAGTHDNHGVRIADNNTLVQSTTGNILINGLGGAGSQEANRGIVVEGGADIQSTGSATVTLDGDGGVGAWGNHGIIIAGAGTTITSSGGNIVIDGLGASSASGWNNGVWIFAGAHIDATNAAGVQVSGLGGNAGASGDNWGIMMEDAGTRITAVNGAISLSGIGRGTTDQNNVGLYMRTGIEVSSTGAGGISLSGSGGDTAAGIVVSGGSNVFGGASATGAMTLTAHTASGTDSISLANATFQSSGELTLQPLNAGTSIGVAGGAGTFNLSNAELALFQNGFSRITVGQAAGTGTISVGAYTFSDPIRFQSNLAGSGGVVNVTGLLQTSSAGDAIEIYAGRGVGLTAGVTTNDGNVTIKGNESGTSTGFSFGVDVNSVTISAGTGDVLVVGNGGDTGDFNIGIRLTNGAGIQTTSGDITLDGTGGPGGSNNWGTLLEWASTTVQSDSGLISITGQGGGSASDNIGVLIQGSSVVQNNTGAITVLGTGSALGTSGNHGVKIDNSSVASTDGNIGITGQGGGTTNDNYGVFVANGATVGSSGLATILLDGTGGNGTWWNVGTYIINSGTAVNSVVGDITINGTGGNGANDSNFGIIVAGSAVIQSTGTAQITMTGVGGDGTWGNHGIAILDPSSTVTTLDGDITMIGTGGAGTQGWNVGMRLQNGVLVESTGLGQINLTGNGTAGAEDNWGFWMDNATVISSDANISITGTGAGTSQTNFGIYLQNAAYVENSGAGDVTLIGTGANADWGNHGVFLTDAGTDVCVTDGNLLIQGFGGNGVGGFNVGVVLDDFAIAESCGAGFVTIEGTGGNGTADNWGFWGFNGSVASNTGDISITGIGNGSGVTNYGMYLETGTQIIAYDSGNIILDARGAGVAAGFKSANAGNSISSLTTGDISLTASTASGADSIELAGIDFAGNNNLVLQPLNAATTIGLGNSATGVFNLSNTEIGMINLGFAGVIIGQAGGSGAMDIRSATWNSPLADLRTSGPVTLQGALTTAGNGSFNFNKAISLAGATSVDTTGSNGGITFGNAVTGGQSLTLNSGSGVVSIAAGLTVDDLSITTTDVTALTQSAAWNVSGTMDINTGGAATLTNGSNSIADLGTVNTGGSFSMVNAGGLSMSGPIAATGGDVTIQTSGVMSIDGTLAGDNVTLVTGTSFVNTAGATPFTLSGGRFLIYSVNPALNTLGGLLYDFTQTGITYPTAPGSAVGNGLLYSMNTPAPTPDSGYVDSILTSFSDSYDRSNRFDLKNQNLANFGPASDSIGYGPPPPLGPHVPGVYISVSSFNVPAQ